MCDKKYTHTQSHLGGPSSVMKEVITCPSRPTPCMHASKQSGCHPLEKDGNFQCTEESYRTVSEQGSQLSHIAHETHTFQTKLTLTRIAPFFSYITHGMRRAMHHSLHSQCWIATRFAKERNYSCTTRKKCCKRLSCDVFPSLQTPVVTHDNIIFH